MNLLNELKELRKKLEAVVECAVNGHIPFNTGADGVARVFQNKEVGNKYFDMHVCDRCGVMFGIKGELTPEELAEENRLEKLNDEFRAKMEKAKDELLKRFTEAKVSREGKTGLN